MSNVTPGTNSFVSAGGSPANLTIPLPTGVAAGDYWHLQVLYTDSATILSVTPNDGEIGTAQLTTENVSESCFYRKITAGDIIVGNVVVAYNTPHPGFTEGALLQLLNVSPTTPFGPNGKSANKGNSATVTSLSVTAEVPGSLLVRCNIPLGGAQTAGPTPGYTNQYSQDGNEFICDTKPVGNGPTGNVTSTQDTTFGTAFAAHAAVFQPNTTIESMFLGSGTTS